MEFSNNNMVDNNEDNLQHRYIPPPPTSTNSYFYKHHQQHLPSSTISDQYGFNQNDLFSNTPNVETKIQDESYYTGTNESDPNVQVIDINSLPPPPPPISNLPPHQLQQPIYPTVPYNAQILSTASEDNNEMFHYQNSNYMNWSLPFYTYNSSQNAYIPLPINLQAPTKAVTIPNTQQQQQQQQQQQASIPSPSSVMTLQNLKLSNIVGTTENEEDDYHNNVDFAMTLLIFILGFFIVIPWFFGVLYLKSKSSIAKRLAKMSLMLGFTVLIFAVLTFLI
ncbi:hypothetical protein DLAC_05771 [Tieghemostelium lacteum]|uniref:Uncharacterized protein n=1 Tax=Tieghemostelium lacteum TaxID=361077 RepID=A0A151ZGM9_TIELA|nr:hypothetical protein DLAC_05771 [Tieghemostelium lacteum]|eukprot:KYQ93138.1 hypothetical protein DLAC_05771 [Tieghemostelium lacteum]